MLEKEYTYFKDNQAAIVKNYDGKVLVISGEEIMGAFDTPLEAYLYGKREIGLGKFIVQKCIPGPEAYTARISTLGIVTYG